jgi:hypothetical protein
MVLAKKDYWERYFTQSSTAQRSTKLTKVTRKATKGANSSKCVVCFLILASLEALPQRFIYFFSGSYGASMFKL